jgi:hypothetical protein
MERQPDQPDLASHWIEIRDLLKEQNDDLRVQIVELRRLCLLRSAEDRPSELPLSNHSAKSHAGENLARGATKARAPIYKSSQKRGESGVVGLGVHMTQ